MKITLDTPRLTAEAHGGFLYVEHLIRSLCTVSPPSWQYIFHTAGWQGRECHANKIRMILGETQHKVRTTPIPEFALHELLRFGAGSSKMLYGKTDIVHAVGARCVPRDVSNLIFTLQDVSGLSDAATASTLWRFQKESLFDVAARAKVVTTISEFSAREICELLPVSRDKVRVIPNGVDHSLFHPLTQQEEQDSLLTLARLDLKPDSYLLFMGGQAPRKNLPRLLEAFDLAKRKFGLEEKLVIAGSRLSDAVQQAWEKMHCKSEVIFAGYLEQSQMIRLLQRCKLLVFPSTYEGFGLPPLEAMACGVPVACSRAASLPEVVGDAAVCFDPVDVESIAQSIAQLASESTLRDVCIERGLKRSRLFSWEEAAKKMIEIYQSFEVDTEARDNRLQPVALPT